MNFTQKLKHMNLVSYKIGVILDRFEIKLNLLITFQRVDFQYHHISGSFHEYRT